MDARLQNIAKFDRIRLLRNLDTHNRPRTARKRQVRAVYHLYDDIQFKNMFKMDKKSAIAFYQLIKNDIKLKRKPKKLDGFNMFLVTVFYLVNGNFQNTNAEIFGISQQYYSDVMRIILPIICNQRHRLIKFPMTNHEIETTKQGFIQCSQFADCIGVLDGTHIPLYYINRARREHFYSGHKKRNTLNCMVVVDSNLKFTFVSARWFGSAHDSHIFKSSKLKKQLANSNYNGYLLADKAYPFSEYCLTPFIHPIDELEHEFNRRHVKARALVERTIGSWKRRFAFLLNPTRTSLNNTMMAVVASAVLWNFLRERNDQYAYSDIESEAIPVLLRGEAAEEGSRSLKRQMAFEIIEKYRQYEDQT